MMCPIVSPKVAMLLISLGIGYLVCVKAEGQKGFLKQLGYWIGSIIITVSILAALCGLYGRMGKRMHFPCMPSESYHMSHMPMK